MFIKLDVVKTVPIMDVYDKLYDISKKRVTLSKKMKRENWNITQCIYNPRKWKIKIMN